MKLIHVRNCVRDLAGERVQPFLVALSTGATSCWLGRWPPELPRVPLSDALVAAAAGARSATVEVPDGRAPLALATVRRGTVHDRRGAACAVVALRPVWPGGDGGRASARGDLRNARSGRLGCRPATHGSGTGTSEAGHRCSVPARASSRCALGDRRMARCARCRWWRSGDDFATRVGSRAHEHRHVLQQASILRARPKARVVDLGGPPAARRCDDLKPC